MGNVGQDPIFGVIRRGTPILVAQETDWLPPYRWFRLFGHFWVNLKWLARDVGTVAVLGVIGRAWTLGVPRGTAR
jgi:hypothetical protein